MQIRGERESKTFIGVKRIFFILEMEKLIKKMRNVVNSDEITVIKWNFNYKLS